MTKADLEPIDLHHSLVEPLLSKLRSIGYTSKRVKCASYASDETVTRDIADNPNGVRLSLTVFSSPSSKKLLAECHVRNHRGKYLSHHLTVGGYYASTMSDRSMFTAGAFSQYVDQLYHNVQGLSGQAVTHPPLKTAKNLYPPLKFDKSMFFTGGEHNATCLMHVYRLCWVRGVATILPNLKVSIDAASTPDVDCWFYISGEIADKSSGAHPEIIVSIQEDHQMVYYPVIRGKVTNDFTPTTSHVDFLGFTELDAKLIERAIETFLKK